MEQYDVRGPDIRWIAWSVTMFAGLSMVSSLPFYSGKDINLRKSVSFTVVVGIALGLVVLIVFARALPEILFLCFSGYALSGYVLWGLSAFRRKSATPPPHN
jgi:CDP-diacylglycerol--serine O-phosphatidyltransferase